MGSAVASVGSVRKVALRVYSQYQMSGSDAKLPWLCMCIQLTANTKHRLSQTSDKAQSKNATLSQL